ncbi:hypothetical protein J2Z48_000467 [Croceifilum oryzae]|uniref:Uncharacterized protein n=1 Tax=Croceifilum oryzae TaxID=1553429 RepID=A0AAJ1WRG6_9BACL|nr:hypothetical protein [Croceifilum oryzae]MDQ0416303.1 hypothetical protein [Croceifilum oryzae]
MLRNKRDSEQGFMIPIVMMVIWLVFQFVHAYISQTVAIQQADFLDSERVKARYAAAGAIDKVLANWKERSVEDSKWSWQEPSVEQAIQITLLPNSESDSEQGQSGILQARATGKLGVRQTISVQINLETGKKIKEVADEK